MSMRALRQQYIELRARPGEVLGDRSCRTVKLQHDPSIEVCVQEIVADRPPVDNAVTGREVSSECPRKN